MGIFDISERISRNLWRVPLVGPLIRLDYERAFLRGRGRYRGVYRNFEEAKRSIPPDQKMGFDHVELAGMYRNRMLKACPSDYAVLYWMRSMMLETDPFIFDFGGHVGISYHGWRNYLTYPPSLRWVVYDLPAITSAGEEIARERPSTGLSFTNDARDARDCSVFLAAGSLQFQEKTLPELFQDVGCRPRHVIVSKLPMRDGEPFVTVQSAGNAFHPYQIMNRRAFVSGMTSIGYRVVDDWESAEQFCKIPFNSNLDIDSYSGFYFKLG
jgi:putative methyltransferase (TIGR04325 family)